MSQDQEKRNLKQYDQSKSEYHGKDKPAEIIKNLNLDLPSKKTEEASSTISEPLKDSDIHKSMPNLQIEKEKDLTKPSETKHEEKHGKKENGGGVFSKVGNIISSVIEKTKEIIFPSYGEGEEEGQQQFKATEKDKNLPKLEEKPQEGKLLEREREKTEEKPYEMPQQNLKPEEKALGAGQGFDKGRQPAYIIGEGENKIVYYYPLEQNLGEKSDLLKPMPESQLGEMSQPLLSGQEKEMPGQRKEFREQPREELSSPIKEEGKHKPELDTEKVRGKLQDLNLNKEEQQQAAPQKEEPKHNENFFQDISKTLQFGEQGDKKMPNLGN
jgi:hypothetical protein